MRDCGFAYFVEPGKLDLAVICAKILTNKGETMFAIDMKKGRKVKLYTKPISSKWGPTRIKKLCADEFGKEPRLYEYFLFFNKKKDTMMLYFKDDDGDQMMSKMLLKGGFLLPAGAEDQNWIEMPASQLPTLFRT